MFSSIGTVDIDLWTLKQHMTTDAALSVKKLQQRPGGERM